MTVKIGLSLSILALALGLGASEAAGAEEPWYELSTLAPVAVGKVVLERVSVEVSAHASGEIEATSRYTLANATARPVKARVALPTGWRGRHPFHDREASFRGLGEAQPSVYLGESATPLDASLFVPDQPIEGLGPGGEVRGLVFDVSLDRYAAVELRVVARVPWSTVTPPVLFAAERGLSLSLAGLRAWPGVLESLTVVVAGEPRLLGPATHARPLPYAYDSRALRWSFVGEADAAPSLSERLAVAVLAGWEARHFDGVHFARFEAQDDGYPWAQRFHQVRIVGQGASVVARARVQAVLEELQEIELVVLARNGKEFDDTFSQLRFQKEPWYKPERSFTEARVRPVEAWNLEYARCQARAARTVLSAFDKMGVEELDAGERRTRMLLEAFERCDAKFWSPKPRRKESPRLQ